MAILQCDMHSVNRQHTDLLQSAYIQMTHNRSKHKDVKTFRGLHADLTEEEHDWSHFTIIVGILKRFCMCRIDRNNLQRKLCSNIRVIFWVQLASLK